MTKKIENKLRILFPGKFKTCVQIAFDEGEKYGRIRGNRKRRDLGVQED